jgi:hypothetical protein
MPVRPRSWYSPRSGGRSSLCHLGGIGVGAGRSRRYATLVILINTDNSYQNQEPSTLLGEAITEIVTPDHVYGK